MSSIGFIILRHVNSKDTNRYWNHCYDCVRKYYPDNFILIIDDNSNYEYIMERILYKTTIINSEYNGRGELLPYYYYLENKLFDTAVFLHDTCFINKYVDMSVDNYKLIWDFEHYWDLIEGETIMIKCFNDTELLNFYENKELWKGCFGGMSIITYDFLQSVNNVHNIKKLLDYVVNRETRCCFERVFGCILQKHYKKETLLGSIHSHLTSGASFDNKEYFNDLPIIKVFAGR